VVISPLYEYLHTPGVKIYRSVEEFMTLVAEALASDTPCERQSRQAAVRDCTLGRPRPGSGRPPFGVS